MTMSADFFYFPTSFYSQRVRLALEEKKIPYKSIVVSLKDNEQSKPWYMRINPNGQVPALRLGKDVYIESESIVDVVDKLPSVSQLQLVPDLETQLGKAVAEWRMKIDAIPIPNLTFGVLLFPENSPNGLKDIPKSLRFDREGARKRFENNLQELRECKENNPDIADLYNRKMKELEGRLNEFFDRGRVPAILDNVNLLMKEIDDQLTTVAAGDAGAQWLCGSTFTAADINLCILLGRFKMLGLTPRFLDPTKYPSVVKYWERAQTKPTVKKVVINNINEVRNMVIVKKICQFSTVAVTLGVVGFAIWYGYKSLKK